MRHQPQGRVRVNRSNPIARKLVSLLWLGDNKPRDLVNPSIVFTVTGGVNAPVRGVSKAGRGLVFNPTTDSLAGVEGPRGQIGIAKLTQGVSIIHVGGNHKVSGGGRGLFGIGDGANGGYTVANNYGKVLGYVKTAAGLVAKEGSLFGNATVLGMTCSTTLMQLYIDGRKDLTAARTGDIIYDNTYGHIQAGGNTEGVSSTGAFAQFGAAFDGVLSEVEMLSLYVNPWQLVEEYDDDDADYVGGGASDTPVAPGAGGIILTGYAPTVARTNHRSVVPGGGGLSIQGFAPTVARTDHKNVAPAAGGLAITGHAPSVTQSSAASILPGAGGLAIVGHAPTVTRSSNYTAAPAAGALAITGYPPAVAQTHNIAMGPPVGSVRILGHAPTVTQTGAQVFTRAPAGAGYTPRAAAPSVRAGSPGVSRRSEGECTRPSSEHRKIR